MGTEVNSVNKSPVMACETDVGVLDGVDGVLWGLWLRVLRA